MKYKKSLIFAGLVILVIVVAFENDATRSFVAKSQLPEKFEHYSYPSEGNVESGIYEIKQISDDVIHSLFFDRKNKQIIACWKDPFQEKQSQLWKISESGNITDTLRFPRHLSVNTSGVFYRDSSYIDWVYSGDKKPKRYSSIINMDSLSKPEFKNYLQKATVVDIRKDYDNEKGRLLPKFHLLPNRNLKYLKKGMYALWQKARYCGGCRSINSGRSFNIIQPKKRLIYVPVFSVPT